MSAAKPPAGTWALCDVCGLALVHKNATTGWRHSLLGAGRDHEPAPHGWDYAASPAAAPAEPLDALIDSLAETQPKARARKAPATKKPTTRKKTACRT